MYVLQYTYTNMTSSISPMLNKKRKGQFYTTNSDYILAGFIIPDSVDKIIEPFAGKGDLLDWISTQSSAKQKIVNRTVMAYDIEPKRADIVVRDTLMDAPDYNGCWVITNPPYLARNKCETKSVFDKYDTNDLYKCFLKSMNATKCRGGIIIIPAGFFFSPRAMDRTCRNDFMSRYKIVKIRYFEERVFEDTATTVVAILFEYSPVVLTEQCVHWVMMPSGEDKEFVMTMENDWIIGGEIYRLPTTNPSNRRVKITRHVEGLTLKHGDEQQQQTFMTLNALDSGKKDGRIALEYKRGYVYPAKECSRTYATIRIAGLDSELTEEEQKKICLQFNELLEKKREEYWSLFLPQFRESKEYARKRIPFELAYRIIGHVMMNVRP